MSREAARFKRLARAVLDDARIDVAPMLESKIAAGLQKFAAEERARLAAIVESAIDIVGDEHADAFRDLARRIEKAERDEQGAIVVARKA